MKTNEHLSIGARTSVRFTFLMRSRCGLKSALLSAALALFSHGALSQTWQTVDDFQYAPGYDAGNAGLAFAPNGTLFACGDGTDTSGVDHALVMASADGGNTWSAPLDDFVYPGSTQTFYNAGIAADAAGNLYVAGTAYDSASWTNHWIVRRSTDGGASWSTVDAFTPGGFTTEADAITVDAADNVYVVGVADYNTGNSYWTVRKGVGGTAFATVDSIPKGGGFTGSAITALAVFVHPTAGVFVAGQLGVVVNKSGGTAPEWAVRRSVNGGATWTTIDTFAFTNKGIYPAEAHGIGTDSLGNLYVVGKASAPTKGAGYSHWVVRKSADGGNSWTTVDNYQPSSTGGYSAQAIVADSHGNLCVAGYGSASNVPVHWIVRQSAGGTGIWSTVDDFQYLTGGWTQAGAIAANASGNVFVGGLGGGSTGASHWVVRKR